MLSLPFQASIQYPEFPSSIWKSLRKSNSPTPMVNADKSSGFKLELPSVGDPTILTEKTQSLLERFDALFSQSGIEHMPPEVKEEHSRRLEAIAPAASGKNRT